VLMVSNSTNSNKTNNNYPSQEITLNWAQKRPSQSYQNVWIMSYQHVWSMNYQNVWIMSYQHVWIMSYQNVWIMSYWWLVPFSVIFQLYRSGLLLLVKIRPKWPDKATNLSQVMIKLTLNGTHLAIEFTY
jgi:hypothetical protein